MVRENRRERVEKKCRKKSRKDKERRKVTQEGGVGRGSQREHHLRRGPGTQLCSFLVSAVSTSNSWLCSWI